MPTLAELLYFFRNCTHNGASAMPFMLVSLNSRLANICYKNNVPNKLGMLNNYRIFDYRIKCSCSFFTFDSQNTALMVENAQSSKNSMVRFSCLFFASRCDAASPSHSLPVNRDTATFARGRQTRRQYARQ